MRMAKVSSTAARRTDPIPAAVASPLLKSGEISEVILALSATMEGETTNFYIYRQLGTLPVKITQLARGVSVGNEIEYTDEITLGRSLLNRTLFADSFNNNR